MASQHLIWTLYIFILHHFYITPYIYSNLQSPISLYYFITMLTYNSNNVGPFGDTTLTKVFVGGLAWETPNDALKNHFEKFGDILEAVIINDKTTGRSKGYGFVCFIFVI